MKEMYLSILLFVIVVMVAMAVRGSERRQKKQIYRYTKKDFFLTPAEHTFYDALGMAVGKEYRIFAQVHLASLLNHRVVGQHWQGAFRHIDEKSVDFVLCDKDHLSPKLAIELDDMTHERADRQERDREVERMLGGAGMPLLRIKNHGHFDPAVLAQAVEEKLANSR